MSIHSVEFNSSLLEDYSINNQEKIQEVIRNLPQVQKILENLGAQIKEVRSSAIGSTLGSMEFIVETDKTDAKGFILAIRLGVTLSEKTITFNIRSPEYLCQVKHAASMPKGFCGAWLARPDEQFPYGKGIETVAFYRS